MAMTATFQAHDAALSRHESAQPKRPGLLSRLNAALMQARMRQAEREIARYAHLIPHDVLREAGLRVGLTQSDRLPFNG